MSDVNKMYFQEGTAKLRDNGFVDIVFTYLYNDGKEDKVVKLKGAVNNPIINLTNRYCGPKDCPSDMRNWPYYKTEGTISFEFIEDPKVPGEVFTLEMEDIEKIRGIDE